MMISGLAQQVREKGILRRSVFAGSLRLNFGDHVHSPLAEVLARDHNLKLPDKFPRPDEWFAEWPPQCLRIRSSAANSPISRRAMAACPCR